MVASHSGLDFMFQDNLLSDGGFNSLGFKAEVSKILYDFTGHSSVLEFSFRVC